MVITYNQIDFIHETIQSVLDQDYPNIEYVIADDGSTDGTADIIEEYASEYPRIIKVITRQPNVGITCNSNRGLSECTGKYIAFQGGDDIFLPGKLTAQVKWLESDEKRVLCYHDMDVFESSTDQTLYLNSEIQPFYEGGAELLIKYGTFFGATTVMIRRPELKIDFDTRISIASDWLFWIENVERQHGTLGFIDGVYARYRKHEKNITKISNHFLTDSVLTLEISKQNFPYYSKFINRKLSELYLISSYRNFKTHQYRCAIHDIYKSSCYGAGIIFSVARLVTFKLYKYRAGRITRE